MGSDGKAVYGRDATNGTRRHQRHATPPTARRHRRPGPSTAGRATNGRGRAPPTAGRYQRPGATNGRAPPTAGRYQRPGALPTAGRHQRPGVTNGRGLPTAGTALPTAERQHNGAINTQSLDRKKPRMRNETVPNQDGTTRATVMSLCRLVGQARPRPLSPLGRDTEDGSARVATPARAGSGQRLSGHAIVIVLARSPTQPRPHTRRKQCRIKMPRRAQQLSLPSPRTWGGRRPGAGRKRAGARPEVSHAARPRFEARHPVHVTLRAARRLPSFRSEPAFSALLAAISAASRRRFRVLHFSAQANHLHLIVEASSREALIRGVQGLAGRNRACREPILGPLG